MTQRKRIGPWIIGGLLALVLAATIFAMVRKPAVPVDIAKVERGSLAVTIDDEAETRTRDVYVVSAPITGRLLRVSVEPGDRVTAGQPLAQMTPMQPQFIDTRQQAELRARVASLEAMAAGAAARINEAKAASDLASSNLARNRAIYERGFLAKAALERAQAEADRTEAALIEARRGAEASRFDLAAARASLAQPQGDGSEGKSMAITAPVSGWVLRIPQKSEASVGAGAPIIEIGDPAKLEIVTDLLSADSVRIKVGADAWLDQWGGDKPIPARVRLIEPYGFTKISALGVEEQRVNVLLDFTGPVEQRARLGYGYRGIIRIVTVSKADVRLVPISALFRVGSEWALFKVEGGRARQQIVKIGAMNSERAELLSSMAVGSQIIVHPGDRVADGVRVTQRTG
jgi:HlyD family secretion protein